MFDRLRKNSFFKKFFPKGDLFRKEISRSKNRRHCRLSFGQVLTTFTYEHGIRDIQRLHSGECRIRLHLGTGHARYSARTARARI